MKFHHGEIRSGCLFLAIVWSPIILVVLLLLLSFVTEPIISTLHLRQINELREPLSIGERWEEEFFTFSLDQVSELPPSEWETTFPAFFDFEYDASRFTAYELQFSFSQLVENKKLGKSYDLYACNRGKDDQPISCPMPANTLSSMTASDTVYYILASNDTEYIDVCVHVPYGTQRYYRQEYRFYPRDI